MTPVRDETRTAGRGADAEFALLGPQDMASSRIHVSDESVDPSEIERMILAQAFFLEELAFLPRKGG
jgi:hypothetical protein